MSTRVYRDLLTEITLNPVMGEYLSMKGNRKPDTEINIQPDENYARELHLHDATLQN